jgi:hypothetical protein
MCVDGAYRYIHGVGYVAVAQTVDIAQFEYLAAFLRQFVDGVFNLCAQFALFDFL